MAISIVNVIKQSAKFNIVSLVGKFISVPRNIIVAAVLLPEDYGIIGFVGLWSIYAGLINPGINSAGSREMVYLLGKNEKEEALRIQNTFVTGNLAFSILPFMAIFCASFLFPNPVKVGLILTAIGFALNCIVNRWSGVNFARQKFTLVAKGNLINSIAVFAATVILIYWLRIYAVLLAPIVGAGIAGIYFWNKGPIGYSFQFDWQEIKRLMKVGVIISLGTLAFWGYRMADRTIIAASLSLTELGFYTYAMTFIFLGTQFFSEFGNVLQPVLWEHSGKVENPIDAFSDTKRIAVYMALVSGIIIPVSQLGFYLLVSLITTKYISSIPIFYVLSYNLYLASMVILPAIILKSKIINRQSIFTLVYAIGLGFNIVLDLAAIHFGYGVLGVAWVTVATQGIVTFVLYFLIRKHVFTKLKEFTSFIILINFPLLISILFSVFHNFLNSLRLNHWFFACISLVVQVFVWSLVITILYRRYFPRKKIINLMKELINMAKIYLSSNKFRRKEH